MSFNLLYCKDMVKPYYTKGVQSIKKNHLFGYVLQNNIYKVNFLKVLQNSKENTYVGVTF